MRYSIVLFDLDGTLTDPSEGITKSVQYALSKFDIVAELDQLRSFIGPPLHHSFMRTYGFEEPVAMDAVGHYREYFGDRGIYENRMFDGIPELLQALLAKHASLCLVTSKPAVYSEQILTHFGIDRFFEAVVAPGLDLADAEKTVLVHRARGRFPDRPATDFVMVGDREHDIIGAIANGIDSIGVTYGAGSREELMAASATHIVDSVEELRALLL